MRFPPPADRNGVIDSHISALSALSVDQNSTLLNENHYMDTQLPVKHDWMSSWLNSCSDLGMSTGLFPRIPAKKSEQEARAHHTCFGPAAPASAGNWPFDFCQVILHSTIVQMTPTLILVASFEGCTYRIPGMPLCLCLYISLYRKSMRWNSIEKKEGLRAIWRQMGKPSTQ